ncbi:MAG: DEAD/DEAH box helicase [Crenarchaeota archaeon]|nr:DEAD/DEAH box helicase [Thermoproteota archaeon]
MHSDVDDILLSRAFSNILLLEAQKIDPKCSPGEICRIKNPSYCLSRDDLVKTIENTVKSSLRSAVTRRDLSSIVMSILDRLDSMGMIIRVNNTCYRSIFFDILLRASDLRIMPGYSKMVLSSSFSITRRSSPSLSDRIILPGENIPGNPYSDLSAKLGNLLRNILSDTMYNVFVETLRRYFGRRGTRGFDGYQAYSIYDYIKEMDTARAVLIVAPTGAGKTEVFTTITLIDLLRNLNDGFKYVFIYPRKMLEIDQMSRLVELLYMLNEILKDHSIDKKIRIYIRDGDTYKILDEYDEIDVGDEIEFRGIRCGINGKLYIRKTSKGPMVICKDENREEPYDFIIPFPGENIGAKKADIIVSNIDTIMYAAFTRREYDIDIYDLVSSRIIVFDEIHEYDSIKLAQIYYLLKIIKSLQKDKLGREIILPILSSATIGQPIDFAEKLVDVPRDKILDLTYDHILRKYSDIKFSGVRTKIYLFLQMTPMTSWETYLSELASLILYLHKAYSERQSGKHLKYVPQSIFFVNNVREINRLNTITIQALSLGSPLDILCIRNPERIEDCSLDACVTNRDRCRHYFEYITPHNLKQIIQDRVNHEGGKASIADILKDQLGIIYSEIPINERENLYEKLRRGELGVVFATTTLELGVDYPNVSIIVNAGFDKVESMIQRIGRGGRSRSSLWTNLSIILARNNPLDYRLYSDISIRKNIVSENTIGGHRHFIAEHLYSIRENMLIKYALAYSILNNYYRNLYGGRRIGDINELINIMHLILNVLLDEEFKKRAINEIGFVNEDEYRSVIESLEDLIKITEESILPTILEDISEDYAELYNLLQELYRMKDYVNNIRKTVQNVKEHAATLNTRLAESINEITDSILDLLGKYESELEEYINKCKEILRVFSEDLIYLTRVIVPRDLESLIDEIASDNSMLGISRMEEKISGTHSDIKRKIISLKNRLEIQQSEDTDKIIAKLDAIIDELGRINLENRLFPVLKRLRKARRELESIMKER